MQIGPLPGQGGQGWDEALRHTHEEFNLAVRFWSDLLLTACGGFQPAAATGAGDGTEGEQRFRRILLALSWLRVESRTPENERYRVPSEKLAETLQEILRTRGADSRSIGQWTCDCHEIFHSAIREDACWVNRARKFDDLVAELPDGAREAILEDAVFRFVPEGKYWALENQQSIDQKADYIKPARELVSNRLGMGRGKDFASIAAAKERIADWAEKVSRDLSPQQLRTSLALAMGWRDDGNLFFADVRANVGVNGPQPTSIRLLKALSLGHPIDLGRLASACRTEAAEKREKIGQKSSRGRYGWLLSLWNRQQELHPFPTQTDFRASSLSEAAIRVFSNWSWIKRSVRERESAAADRSRLQEVPEDAQRFLDEYCRRRADETGALAGYRIRRRAIEGWERVVEAWSQHSCRTQAQRESRVAALQAEWEEGRKFGDATLFHALAADEARCVWLRGGVPEPQILAHYVAAREAEAVYRERKVPMFRHVDAWQHPAFLQFGKSRLEVRYTPPGSSPGGVGRVSLQLIDPARGELERKEFAWRSKRLRRELFGVGDGEAHAASVRVPRFHRLALAAGGAAAEQQAVVRLFEGKEQWNGRLQFRRDIGGSADNPRWLLTLSAQLSPLASAPRPNAREDARRGYGARLLFSRQQEGFRVLGVDLGQRHAAACAVWQTLSRESVEKECRLRGVPVPTAEDLHALIPDEAGRLRVYRRIGGDLLADGRTAHPAPWARLERTFLIRLPGEDHPARPILPEEKAELDRFVEQAGFPVLKERRVDLQMRHCLRQARRFLRELAELARLPELLTQARWEEAARRWQALSNLSSPLGKRCAAMWAEALGETGADPNAETQGSGGSIPEKAVRLETALASNGEDWANRFEHFWQEQHELGRQMVRWLRQWVAPQGRHGKGKRSAGGLSMLRINNLTDLYRLEKSWATLPTPNAPTGRVVSENFCAKLLEMRDRLRETRVRLIASRILEAALGVGREPEKRKAQPLPKRANSAPADERHRRCDAIVIEDLSGYGTAETRLRRENRMLMNWSKGRILKHLREGAELLGIPLLEVVPNYTSRQDSRTGAPGLRMTKCCVEVLLRRREWQKRLEDATTDTPQGSYLCQLRTLLRQLPAACEVYLPDPAGDTFMTADADSPIAGGIHADLNAAANIALRALRDPDWPGAWWYLPVNTSTGRPDVADRLKGCQAEGLKRVRVDRALSRNGIRNVWRDPSALPLDQGEWQLYGEYWEGVQQRVFTRLLKELHRAALPR
ncbi:MAG: type V CRISPR-associated protein Cas12b [Arcobacter sp.]|nr:type V CRISPR-associated protein Cas12b [Bryobacteraceae bacterium]MDW8434529.1 type V CRISPR-associated protein Cas12b [Arcobacter sp.]